MFQTADFGESINASQEKVEEMGMMPKKPNIEAPESPAFKSNLGPSNTATVMFQRDSSRTSISLSEKVKDMGKMLNTVSSSKAHPSPSTAIASEKSQEKTSAMQTSPSMELFRTSKEGETTLNEPSASDQEKITSTSQSENFSLTTMPSHSKQPGMPIATASNGVRDSIMGTNRSIPTAMFQTAGSGASISVSQKKIEEMGLMLSESSFSSEDPGYSKTLYERPLFTVTQASNSFQTPRAVTKTNDDFPAITNEKSGSTNLPIPMFQKISSDTETDASKTEQIEETGRLSLCNTDPICQKIHTDYELSTRTPITVFQIPRLVTAAKDSNAAGRPTSFSIFQTAGSGKAIEVSEETVEKMGFLLEKPNSSDNASASKKVPSRATEPSSQSYCATKPAEVSTMTESNYPERSRIDGHDFVEAGSSSYSYSPLRINEAKSDSSPLLNHETVTCTPQKDTLSTPHQKVARWDSIRRTTFGITPQSGSINNNLSSVRSGNGGALMSHSSTDDNARDNTNVFDGQKAQDVHLSPQGSKPSSMSANVTMSCDDRTIARKTKLDRNCLMTPVPFDVNTLDGAETRVREQSPAELTLQNAIRLGNMSTCPSLCRRHGVREVTLMINYTNSLQLRFDSDGMPLALASNEEDSPSNLNGRCADIRQSLIDNGCDASRLKDAWIRNHTKLVVWKLACYERSFSQFLADKHLTYHNLIQNLISRFQKEVISGLRPAIRKILNRDVAATKMMILVVCRILPSSESKSNDTSPQSTKIELSDGWYSVKGCLDANLSEYVKNGWIKVGTKLLVSNARLVGAEDGIDPLDEVVGGNCQNCAATLQLTTNATRLARWDAKLGFLKASSTKRNPKGRLLVNRISDVVVGGGNIPAIRLFVQRVYPMLYYEKRGCSDDFADVSCSKPSVFTEQEEDSRRREFEARKLRAIEKVTEKIQAEIEKEVDEGCPEVWKQMMGSSTPEETFESFSNHDKEVISRWRDQRTSLVNRRVREEVESELETQPSLIRESTSFLRVKVYSINPKSSCNESATLTIWQPTEDQLGFLTEGTSVEFHNLAVRESKSYDGTLQLVANNRTVVEPFSFDACSLAEKIGFRQRQFLSMFQVHALAHETVGKRSRTKTSVDFDVVGVQVHVVPRTNSSDEVIFYISDETNLVLRIHCRNPPSALKTLILAEKQSFPSYGMRDLSIRSFDYEKQCAVAEFRETSSVVLTNKRLENLGKWASSSAHNELHQITAYLNAGLPIWEQECNEKTYLGYAIGLRCESVENVFIIADCCGQGTNEWKLPVHVLQQMISSISEENLRVTLCPDEEDLIAKLGRIGSILRARGVLWQFQISSQSESVVYSATKASKTNVGHIYAALQQ